MPARVKTAGGRKCDGQINIFSRARVTVDGEGERTNQKYLAA